MLQFQAQPFGLSLGNFGACFSLGEASPCLVSVDCELASCLLGSLSLLLLGLEALGELPVFVTDTRDLLLLLGDDVEQPAGRYNLGMDCERALVFGAALLGDAFDVAAVVEDAAAVLLRADLLSVACRLALTDSEQIGDVFNRDIDGCLVMT